MNIKVLYIVFLCLFSASVICNVAMTAMNTPLVSSRTEPARTSYLILGGDGDGNEPAGDDKDGRGWPK